MKRLLLATFGLLFVAASAASAYLVKELSHRDRIELSCKSSAPKSEKLAVRLIGDSWIAGNKMDAGVKEAAEASYLDAVVSSEGIPGARSKLIGNLLQNAFDWHDTAHPDRSFVLLVDGGINDKIANLGADFYVAHMRAIVEASLRCGATVAIITIPPFDKYGLKRSAFDLARWRFYAMLSGDRTDSDATEYNAALANDLKNEIAAGRVILIKSNQYIRPEDVPGRFLDRIHLKPEEMAKFSRSVGDELFARLPH